MIAVDNVYVTVALLLLFGLILGNLAKLIKLPSITGNILAGILLGPLLGIVDTSSPTTASQLEPMIGGALSLIAIGIGSHLKFRRLRNALHRIITLGAIQTLLVPLTVFGCTLLCGQVWKSALFLGVLALATAPGTILHVVKETQSRGTFVKTLIAVVVFNNVLSILLFEATNHWIFGEDGENLLLVSRLIGSLLLGIGSALLLIQAWNRGKSRKQIVTFTFTVLGIVYGIALQLEFAPVLTYLTLGITVANFAERNRILDLFEDFEGVIFTIFFTIMGTHAHFSDWGSVGLLAVVYFLARILGNILSVSLASRFTRLPKKVKNHLALSLTPHAGLTVGLLIALQTSDTSGTISKTIVPVVLLAITFCEVIGPLLLRFALHKTGEEKKALPRMVDFLQEEFIKVDLETGERNDTIRTLVDFLFRAQPALKKQNREAFLQGVLEREERGDTSIAPGLAIPHFMVEEGPKIMGVMGIVREGVNWGTIEKTPVHVIILIAIPPNHHKQHLGALSAIAKLFHRRSVHERSLHHARTASEVYEALVDEEFESLNHVLEEEAAESIPENPELAERFRVQALTTSKLWNLRKRILDK